MPNFNFPLLQIRPTPRAPRAAGQQGSGPASNTAAATSALTAASLANKLELELGMQSENVSQVSGHQHSVCHLELPASTESPE